MNYTTGRGSSGGNDSNHSKYLVFVSTSPKSSSSQSSSRRLRTATAAAAAAAAAATAAATAATAATTAATNVDPAIVAAAASSSERQLSILDLATFQIQPLLKLPSKRRHDGTAQQEQQQQQTHNKPKQQSSLAKAAMASPSSASSSSSDSLSLEERLRRERQRMHSSGGITQFCWTANGRNNSLRLLVPIRGSLYVQDGLDSSLRVVYDKHSMDQTVRNAKGVPAPPAPPPTAAIDPQLSPDGQLCAFCVLGEIFVAPCHDPSPGTPHPPVQVTFGADLPNSVTHGLADFVAQEEMDRYRGFWWSPDSAGVVFARVDESRVPPYRITHHEHETASADSCVYEDHRYPFAGKANPSVRLGYVRVDGPSLLRQQGRGGGTTGNSSSSNHKGAAASAANGGTTYSIASPPSSAGSRLSAAGSSSSTYLGNTAASSTGSGGQRDSQAIARHNWEDAKWFDPPREAAEYLARLDFLPDGSACAQWQNRTQNCLVLARMDLKRGTARTLLVERSDVWINLHHLLHVLERPVHPRECGNTHFQPPLPDPLPGGSFSFLFGSERSGYCHLYLYTYVPGVNGDQAMLVRQVSAGDWVVESIVGVSMEHNAVYVAGTYDSVLERHLYALPIVTPEADYEAPVESTAMDTESSGTITHSGHPNGVRRGLKQVINALSGKSHHSNGNSSQSYANNHQREKVASSVATSTPGSILTSSSRSTGERTEGIVPVRLTQENGMHSVVMDPDCSKMVDTSSDLGRPTTVKIYQIPEGGPFSASAESRTNRKEECAYDKNLPVSFSKSRVVELRLLHTLYDALRDDKAMDMSADSTASLLAPELLTFPSSDGSETLHAALYRPDSQIHGPGPYPLVCAVYGGPHVQRVNRSWSQCADMRAQRLRSLGFCVVKCDNRGSSRRGLAFESAISRRLGRLEVLDQVAVVRQLSVRGIADPTRVGIYGWSYGGYLAAMCLCRAPDVFHVAVAGAPVTSWDGYDTHYTERYMGLPSENPNGYRESAVFDHVPNMRGNLLLVHGLIDENVHFRHTARLINRLIAAGKDYDLLLFPDERHSPRRLRDRIYMEQRISDYFLKHLSTPMIGGGPIAMRQIAGL